MSDDVNTRNGLDTIATMFAEAEAEGRAAFLPYFPLGYPDYEESIDAVLAMAEVGVDGFEIGIPFSDPLADGPTIQAATQTALENGMTVKRCLAGVKQLREQGVKQPMLMMGYLNPLLAYGTEDFVRDAKAAGADGLIVPDLPPEEASLFAEACAEAGLALVFFLAPTSNSARIKIAAEHATGFIYVVSLTGVTGERTELPENLKDFIATLREQTDRRLVLGFGIGTPEQAQMVSKLTDGFIVGSALVRAAKDGTEAVRQLARSLRESLNNQP